MKALLKLASTGLPQAELKTKLFTVNGHEYEPILVEKGRIYAEKVRRFLSIRQAPSNDTIKFLTLSSSLLFRLLIATQVSWRSSRSSAPL